MPQRSVEALKEADTTQVPVRRRTFRVENIPCGTTRDQLKGFFRLDDQSQIEVKSLVPAIDNIDGRGFQTATIQFSPPSSGSTSEPRATNDAISVDKDFYGFTPLSVPQGYIAADVIAVTGLAGHAFGSWSHSPERMWLRDDLPTDIPNVRVIVYGDYSCCENTFEFTPTLVLLIQSIAETKEVLSDINGAIGGGFPSRLPVQLIVFMGAPHRGLDTTALETLVKSKPTEGLVRELKAGSPTLTELNDKFRHIATDITILSCFESNPTKTAIEKPDGSWKREGNPVMMVPLDNARLFFPREICIDSYSDHSRIAKLRRSEAGIYPDIKSAIRQAVADTANERAVILQKQGHFSAAESILRRALDDDEGSIAIDLDMLLSAHLLGLVLHEQRRYSEAGEMFRQAVEGWEGVLGSEHADTLQSKYSLGIALYFQEKYVEAEGVFRQAAEGQQKVLGSEHESVLWSKHWLGRTFSFQKNFVQAEKMFGEIVERQEKVLGPEHADTLENKNWLGRTIYLRGNYLEAEEAMRRVVEGRERVLGPEHKDTLESKALLGRVLYFQERFLEAEGVLRRAAEARERVLGSEDTDTLESKIWLGRVLYFLERFSEAEGKFRQAAEGLERVLGSEHIETQRSKEWVWIASRKQT
ncbi:MAG: hypothetical protein M1840_008706 [Geoglossum simile]|nr:MAG: hypothetical protein M1840_008706 [Geoglossum simile]